MENLITRHRNVSILVAVLFAQVLGLAVQVKRANTMEGTRLIQLWTVSAITPFEKALVWAQRSTSNVWHNYVYLRGLRAENRVLKEQIEQMRLEQVRLSEDAEQARRLQLLLGFKERFIAKTVAAQVIGSSGSEQSRAVYIDKGTRDGVQPDQAVITADGIVGKVLRSFDSSALVLLVNDQSSGVGVVLEKSRVQGVLRGTATGDVVVEKIMSDEAVQPGERVLTSGGDQIFPKGLYVGTLTKVAPGSESFLNVRVKPGANLSKLEEVLVVTQIENRLPTPVDQGRPVRAVDILTQRLPSVPEKPAPAPASVTATGPTGTTSPAGSSVPKAGDASPPAGSRTSQTEGQGIAKTAPEVQNPKRTTAPAGSGAAEQKTAAEPTKPTTGPATAKGISANPPQSEPQATAPAVPASKVAATPASTTGAATGPGASKPAVLPEQPARTGVSRAQPTSSKPRAVPVEDKPE